MQVSLNGETPFSTISGFSLVQRYDSHHSFELRVPLESVESHGTQTLNKSKSFLGQNINFKINEGDDSGSGATDLEFNGVVTGISISRYGGTASDLLVRGFSPTVILDHGLNTKAIAQTTLSALVSMTTSKYPSNGIQFKVSPSPDPQLAFVHQQKESNYTFLCRLANTYGQWFFFDGKTCVFGKPAAGSTIALEFGTDLTEFELGLALAPTKFKTLAQNGNSQLMQAPAAPVAHLDQWGAFAFDQSNKYFFEEQIFNTEQSVTSESDVQDIARIRRSAIAAGLVKFKGASINAKLKIGGSISVSAENPGGSGSTDYGTYIVTALKHTVDGRGKYGNHFEAISAAVDIPPPINIDAHNYRTTHGF